jgi:hypothetical protein
MRRMRVPRGAAIGPVALARVMRRVPVRSPPRFVPPVKETHVTDITARERRYKIGAVVNLIADKYHRGTPDGIYKVASLMPAEGQEYQYRIKDTRTGNVFVVRESQLR